MAEKTLAQLAIGYTGMAASVSIGAYLASQLLVQLFRAYRLRKCREQAEAEAKALCESPRQFTPEECARAPQPSAAGTAPRPPHRAAPALRIGPQAGAARRAGPAPLPLHRGQGARARRARGGRRVLRA